MSLTAHRWMVIITVCILTGIDHAWNQSDVGSDSPFEILVLRGSRYEDLSVRALDFVWFNYDTGSERPYFLYTRPDGLTMAAYEVIDERHLFIVEAISESAGWGELGQYRFVRIDMLSGQREVLYEHINLVSFDISEQGNYSLIGYWPADLTYIERGQEVSYCVVDWTTQVCTEVEVIYRSSFWWNEDLARISYSNEQGERFLIRYNPATLEESTIRLPNEIGLIVDTHVSPISYRLFLIESRDSQSDVCYLWRSNDTQDALEEIGQVVCDNIEDISFDENSAVLRSLHRDTITIISLLTGQTTDVIPVPFNTNNLGYNRPQWRDIELINVNTETRTTLLIADLNSENGFPLVRAFYSLHPTLVAQNFQRVYPLGQEIDRVVPAD